MPYSVYLPSANHDNIDVTLCGTLCVKTLNRFLPRLFSARQIREGVAEQLRANNRMHKVYTILYTTLSHTRAFPCTEIAFWKSGLPTADKCLIMASVWRKCNRSVMLLPSYAAQPSDPGADNNSARTTKHDPRSLFYLPTGMVSDGEIAQTCRAFALVISG